MWGDAAMANAIYPKWKEAIEQASSNSSLGGTVKACLVQITGTGTPYTYSASDQFLSDIPSGARASITAALTGKTFTNGVFDADDTVFPLVPAGPACGAIVIFIDTGTASTSRLVFYDDTSITGAPITPSGTDINVIWDNGANKIFAL
jgi:hypothetical protein